MNPLIEAIARKICELHAVDPEERIPCDCCGEQVSLWEAYAEPATDTIDAAERLGYRLVKVQ
jgi:hypothetical protein